MGDQQHRFVGRAHDRVDARADRFQRVDVEAAVGLVEHREPGVHDAQLDHLGALLLAAGKADVDRALEHLRVHAEQRGLVLRQADEFGAGEILFAARAALRVEAFAQELEVGDAGDFDRILEAEEQPRRGALVRLRCAKQASLRPSKVTLPFGHFIARPPAEHIGERRLARAVRPHDRMDLAGRNGERQPVEDRLAGDGGVEVFNLSIIESF